MREKLVRGRYREALESLERKPRPEDAGWWRLRGWARWHLGDRSGLEDVRHAAEMLPGGSAAGWAWQDVGALLFRAGEWTEAGKALERALDHFRAARNTEGAAWALHGLGVSLLHRGRAREALARAEGAWAEARRRGGLRGFSGRALVLLANAHRALGELDEAAFRARQALRRRLDADDRVVALKTLGTTLRLAGRPAEGRSRLRGALRLAGGGVRRAAALAELAGALVLLDREREAERALGEALPLLEAHAPAKGRALVALAEMARRRGEHGGALRLLREAREGGPYPLAEEAMSWPELFDLAARGGLVLERARRAEGPPPVRLEPWGRRRLHAGDREVPLGGSGRAFELLVFLALEGPSSWEKAAHALWGDVESSRALYRRTQVALARARDLLASREAVRLAGGVLDLDPEREWRLERGRGRFLEGVWTEWAEGVRKHA